MSAFPFQPRQRLEAVFTDFVRTLAVPVPVRAALLDPAFLAGNPGFYLYYPLLFTEALGAGAVPVTQLERLCLAGFLYYRSLIEFDKLLDGNPDQPRSLHLLTGQACGEEGIRLLAGLFADQPEFWVGWNGRKAEYVGAMLLEKKDEQTLTPEAYEQLADGKSAFGKVAIDSVALLAGTAGSAAHAALLDSHRAFSVGFQLLDDYVDFREDLANRQYNAAHHALAAHLGQSLADLRTQSHLVVYKRFHLSGVAERILAQALNYLDRADALVQHLPAQGWRDVIYRKRKEVLLLKLQIEGYQRTLAARLQLATEYAPGTTDLVTASDRALAYVTGQQNEDGSWQEIYNNAGLSNVWATGYIASHLGALAPEAVAAAGRFLQTHRQPEGWGYNTDWIADTDSTTCALLTLHATDQLPAPDLTRWLSWQQPDGGFSTYADHNALRRSLDYGVDDVRGWTQSHPCVSALAYHLLSQVPGYDESACRLEAYLLTQRRANLWDSYWWTSEIYATTYVLRGRWRRHGPDALAWHTLAALLGQQHADGSFRDAYTAGSAFYTALVLSTLAAHPAVLARYRVEAEAAGRWLLAHQFTDGSFASTAALRIPAPHVRDVRRITDWQYAHRMTNIRTDDFMRLFSTAVAAQALRSYHSLRTA